MIGMLMIINAERIKPLKVDPLLTHYAEKRADFLCKSGQWSHDGYGKYPGTPYTWVGENLARGFATDTDANKALMASPSHRANLQDRRFTNIGIAEKDCNGKTYIVELFGGYNKSP
jgi:uncharacterized protein YkwD